MFLHRIIVSWAIASTHNGSELPRDGEVGTLTGRPYNSSPGSMETLWPLQISETIPKGAYRSGEVSNTLG
ncbi:hypothetical protein IAQ61_006953 [Plenodomus lingam]|uniref:Predicted protein n=1 Tax=Leptosphaeria maculans (strain JN3 / isolate v23.1.3 / race Av1-4-5-6-7-8) TaxID=985895 RepID=E5AD15_LEPMJ|nr:predicted protein [Plenodomus lingam JN3]KAH9869740.1 hypothetical protein IAQ61_006953 [Plenodomus lingam]CBY02367.1 predicted protein [Plenodomus lingam JN3]